MELTSTRDPSLRRTFRAAVLEGLAPDGGLFAPVSLPPLPRGAIDAMVGGRFSETALTVATHLLGDELEPSTLENLVRGAFSFPIPLTPLEPGVRVLELFHGPTMAFKDVAARFLARLLPQLADDEITVLVATSGDTGGAVADAFFQVPGTEVVVLYPHGQVSPLQEKQIAGLGGNVTALAVEGSFDDCQRLVKQAFRDEEIAARRRLISANSINIGRLVPQVFYYFQLWAESGGVAPELVAVPSGNLGNLTAGLIAKRIGLPVGRFVAAANANDVVPDFLLTGVFRPRRSVPTLSNAMDVGDPSNFERLATLYDGLPAAIRRDLSGSTHTDEATVEAIRRVAERTGTLMDPHTAVGYLALTEAMASEGRTDGVVLATAHVGKFAEALEPVLGRSIPLPDRLAEVDRRVVSPRIVPARIEALRDELGA